jgi:hypothetical protein
MSALEAITEVLEQVTGGRSPLTEQEQNLAAYQGCQAWARDEKEGRATKLGQCSQEYVRRNWEYFNPKRPGPY